MYLFLLTVRYSHSAKGFVIQCAVWPTRNIDHWESLLLVRHGYMVAYPSPQPLRAEDS